MWSECTRRSAGPGAREASCPPFLPPSPHVLPNIMTSAMHAPGQKVREDEDEDE